MNNLIRVLLVVFLVAVAGCTGGIGGSGDETTDDATIPTDDALESVDGDVGHITFYISDEPNQIGDFEQLNVTISEVGLKPADAPAEEEDGTESVDENDSDTDSGTETPPDAGNETEGDNGTVADDVEAGGWIEYEIDEQTVDLTELQGANATALDVLEAPEGEYDAVFIYVSEIEGTLTDGTEAEVKLPSDKLQIKSSFTVEAGEAIDFVFDIAPHKAGQSGKYILTPVISQSGTGDEVEINDVGAPDEDVPDDDTFDNNASDEDVPDDDTSDNATSDEDVPDNDTSDNNPSDNDSSNDMPEETAAD